MMSKKISILIMVPLLFLLNCKQVDKLTHFTMDYDESIVIPSSVGINLPFNLYSPDIQTDSESQFSINDTRKDLVEQTILKKMVLTISEPSNKTFSFLKSIEIYLKADGLDDILVAWLEDVPQSVGNTLELETSGTDLQEYIKKETFSLKVVTVTDEIITTDYHIDVHTEFFVDAKILGV